MQQALIIPGSSESTIKEYIWKTILSEMGFDVHSNIEGSPFDLVVMKGDVAAVLALRQFLPEPAILAVMEDPYAAEEAAEYKKACERLNQKIRIIRDDNTEITEELEEPMPPPQKGLEIINHLLEKKIGFFYKKPSDNGSNTFREAVLVALALAGQPPPV